MEDAHTAILGGIAIADSATIVGATIVDEQQLKVGVALSQDTINATVDVFFRFVDGDDDAYHVE